jgi:hypothetical protein
MFKALSSPPSSKRPRSEAEVPLLNSMDDDSADLETAAEQEESGGRSSIDIEEDTEDNEWNDDDEEPELTALLPSKKSLLTVINEKLDKILTKMNISSERDREKNNEEQPTPLRKETGEFRD